MTRPSPHPGPPAAALLLALCAACQGGSALPEPAPVPEAPGPFDEDRAWDLLLAQVALGPRPAGTPAAAACRDLIAGELERAGLTPVREAFRAETPSGPIEMENVWAEFEGAPQASGEPAPVLVLGAHYDTKRLPFEFVGANDGASETAALLELARVIAAGPPRPLTYRFLFFDGEEAVRRDWADPDNRYGSRHHVRELTKRRGALGRVRAMVLLDMIGDRDLVLERDSNSSRELLDLFVRTAEALGDDALFARRAIPIKDDHQSFLEFGVPSIDLIDLSYGEVGNEYWHTAQDTVDKCSAESLGRVGRLVLAALPALEARFGR
jgi:hypothetical protein